jgi:hypothetical protein
VKPREIAPCVRAELRLVLVVVGAQSNRLGGVTGGSAARHIVAGNFSTRSARMSKSQNTFNLTIFVAGTDEYIRVDEGILRTHGTVGKAADLPTEEKTLYDLMRSTSIDAAHVAFDSSKQAAAAAFIFGTFYLNLGSFKK